MIFIPPFGQHKNFAITIINKKIDMGVGVAYEAVDIKFDSWVGLEYKILKKITKQATHIYG